jgi:hypothetical protein
VTLLLPAFLVVAAIAAVGCESAVLRDLTNEKTFQDVTYTNFSPEPVAVGWPGLALFDYDNDGDIDIFITSVSGWPNQLFQNDGKGNFTEVSNLAGIRNVGDGSSCAGIGDFDNDGWIDILFGRQVFGGGSDLDNSVRYYRNLGPDENGNVRFGDGTEEAGLADVRFVDSIGVGDFDNDGLLDLYLGRYDLRDLRFENDTYLPDTPNVLLRNTGMFAAGVPLFEDVTESAGVGGTRIAGLGDSADILNRVPTWAVYVTDVNNDGLQDIFSLQEVPGGVDLFINQGDWTFTSEQRELLNKRGGWMGATAADFDRDGDLDYFLTNVGSAAVGDTPPHVTSAWAEPDGTPFHRLLANDGSGNFTDVAGDVAVEAGPLPPENPLGGTGLAAYEFGFGCSFLDVENDGWPDLTWTGDITLFSRLGDGALRTDFQGVSRLLVGRGDGSFRDETAVRGLFYWDPDGPLQFGFSKSGRSLGAADLNGDGFADIVRTAQEAEDAMQVLFNPALEGGNWIIVRLEGSASNRFGIGAKVTGRAGDEVFVGEVVTTVSSFTAVHPQVHFGLGTVDRLDTLTVTWPSGTVTVQEDVTVNRVLTIAE